MHDWSLIWQAATANAAVLALIGSGIVYFARLILRSTLAEFKNELLEQLDGRYLKNDIAILQMQQNRADIQKNRTDIEAIRLGINQR